MLSAPAINPVVLVATAVAFPGQPMMVLARAVASLVTAVAMGMWWLRWGRSHWVTRTLPTLHDDDAPRWTVFTEAARHDFLQASAYLVVGAGAAAALRVLVPPWMFAHLAGHLLLGVLTMALLAVVLALCSEAGNAFVAASLTMLPLLPRLVFLVVGPAVDVKLSAMQAGVFGRQFAVRFGRHVCRGDSERDRGRACAAGRRAVSRATQNLLLLLVGMSTGLMIIKGTYLHYVKPALLPWLITAALVLIVLAVTAIVRDLRALRRTGDVEHHEHQHHTGLAWLLLVPIALIAFVVPPPLGAHGAAPRMAAASQPARTAFPPLPPGESPMVSLPDVLMRAAADSTNSLAGRLITITGFTMKDAGKTDLRAWSSSAAPPTPNWRGSTWPARPPRPPPPTPTTPGYRSTATSTRQRPPQQRTSFQPSRYRQWNRSTNPPILTATDDANNPRCGRRRRRHAT